VKLTSLAADTGSHIVVNFAAIQLGGTIALLLGMGVLSSAGVGLALAIAISVWKELIHDKHQGKGEPSWRDMRSNAVGVVLGLWPWVLMLLVTNIN
jgi:hypothetical protein